MCDPNAIANSPRARSALFLANQENKNANDFNLQLSRNFATNMLQMATRREQTIDQTNQQQSEIARKVAAERARLSSVTNESGTTGNTASRLQTEAKFAGNDAAANTQRNLSQALQQSQWDAESMRRQAIASRKVGVSPEGLSLEIQGILAQEAASNPRALADAKAAQLGKKNNGTKRYGLPGSSFGGN